MFTPVVKRSTEPKPAKQSDNEEEVSSVKFDLIGNLPMEVAQQILLYLPLNDLFAVKLCCSSWNDLVGSEYFWKKLCQREGYPEVHESKRSEYYKNFLKTNSYWQGVYRYNHSVQQNWEAHHFKEVVFVVPQAGFNKINRWFFDDVFACASENSKKLFVHNLNNDLFKPSVFLMKDNVGFDVGKISKSGNYLIYFIKGVSLTAWDLENETKVLDECWNHVTKIHAYKNLVVMESLNKKFEVLNFKTGQIEYTYKGIFKNLNVMDGRILFATRNDVNHILKWEDKSLVTLKCCKKQKSHKLMIKGKILLSFCGKKSTTLCVWNTATMTKLHSTLMGNAYDVESACFRNHFLYIKMFDEKNNYLFELWDYLNGTMEIMAASGANLELSEKCNISNDHCMMIPCAYLFSIYCLRTKTLIANLNFTPAHYDYCDIGITRTKLAYATASASVYGGYDVFLHIRSYEI